MTSLTGLMALVVLLATMIPPLRLTWIDRRVASLSAGYRLHHVMALVLLIVVGIHVAVAMGPYLAEASAPGDVLAFFFDPADPTTLTGTVASLILTLTTVLGATSRLSRRPWLWLHRSAYAGFVVSCAHVFSAWSAHFEPLRDLADFGRFVLGAVAGVVAFSLVVRGLRPDALVSHRHFAVTSVAPLAPRVVELTLRLEGGRGAWVSGDIGFFRFDCRGACGVSAEPHPFTVAQVSPAKAEMRVIVKGAGDDTNKLQRVEVGTPGVVSGPYRGLTGAVAHGRPHLWLAGGVGVVLFLGLLRRPDLIGPADDVVLMYLYRPDAPPLFLDELKRLASERPGLRLLPVAREVGHEGALDDLRRAVPDWRRRDAAIIGPHPMVAHWSRQLRAGGLPRRHIHTEEFLKT